MRGQKESDISGLSFRFCLEQTSFLRITFTSTLVFTSHSRNRRKCQNNFRIPFNFDHKLLIFPLCLICASSLYTSTHLSSHRTLQCLLCWQRQWWDGHYKGHFSLPMKVILSPALTALTDYRGRFRADNECSGGWKFIPKAGYIFWWSRSFYHLLPLSWASQGAISGRKHQAF